MMRPVLLVLIGLVTVATSAQNVWSQQRGDAQSTFEPRSAAGAGQRFLAKFVGDWDVVKTFYPCSGEPVRVTGRCKQTMIHDGRFLQSEFVFQSGGKETTGLGIIGFEERSGKFTSVWTDARSTRMSIRQSREPFSGKEIVLFGQSLPGDERRSGGESRTVTRLLDDGGKIQHRQFVSGPDGKERLIMELMLTRRADPKPKQS